MNFLDSKCFNQKKRTKKKGIENQANVLGLWTLKLSLNGKKENKKIIGVSGTLIQIPKKINDTFDKKGWITANVDDEKIFYSERESEEDILLNKSQSNTYVTRLFYPIKEIKDKIKNYNDEVKLKAKIKSKVIDMKLLMERIKLSCNDIDAGVDMVIDFYFNLLTNRKSTEFHLQNFLQKTKKERTEYFLGTIEDKENQCFKNDVKKAMEKCKNGEEEERIKVSNWLDYALKDLKVLKPLFLMYIFDEHPSEKVLDIVGQCAEDNCTLELISYLDKQNSTVKSISIEWITIEAKKGKKSNCLTYEYKKKCNICQVVFEPRLRSLLSKYFDKNENCHLDENVEKDFEGYIKDEEDIEDIDVLDIENEENKR
eukprot:gene7984-12449_t